MKAKGEVPREERWRTKYIEPTRPNASELPKLPMGWCWSTFEEAASDEPYALTIGPSGSNLKASGYREVGVPLVFVRNIRAERLGREEARFITPEKAAELRPHRVVAGDVLITKMGDPPGDACLYPMDIPGGVITADCIKMSVAEPLSAKFLVYAIRSDIVRRQFVAGAGGVAQQKVSLETFRCMIVPVPPVAEQHRIVAEVERLFSVVDEVEQTVLAQLARAQRLRQSVLKQAFEGKLVPQDPNDEPASALLDRIRDPRCARGGVRRERRGQDLPQAPR